MFTTEPQLQVLLIVYTDPISWSGEMKYYSFRQDITFTRTICDKWVLQSLNNCGATDEKHSPMTRILFLLYDKTRED